MTDDFSSGSNLILGSNGTGKSNLLQAVIFALGDPSEFRQKSKQDKRKFLHEGVNRQAAPDPFTFSVEVSLCNEKREIPVEADLLVVKRSYNVKTDHEEYALNGKTIKQK